MDNYLDQFEQDIQEKPINWREIFETLLVHWKWFVLSVIIALILGVLYVRSQRDVYELKSSILVIDQSRSGQMNEMSLLRQLDAVGMGGRSYSMVNNEQQVISSTILMKKVVERLELYTSYSQKQFLRVVDLYDKSPLYVRLDSASLHNLKGGVGFKMKLVKNGLQVQGSYAGKKFELQAKELPVVLETPAGTLYIQRTNQPMSPDSEINVSIVAPIRIAKSLSRGGVKADVGKMIDIINLTVRTNNVQKGRDILNTLAVVYNEDASDQTSLSAVNTANFIDTRLELLSSELSEVEKTVEDYKQQNKLTDFKADVSQYVERNSSYDRQQVELEMQKNLIKYVDEFVKNPNNEHAIIPNLGISDPLLVGAIQEYNKQLMIRERLADGTSDINPALITLDKEIKSTRNAIFQGIEASKKGLQITSSDLQVQNKLIQSRIRELPRQEREFIEIKRQQQVKESLYLFLLQKREEAALTKAVSVPKGRVLDTPDDASKVAPRSNLILLVFFFAGLILPALIIYLIELINTNIRFRSDVEKLTDLPIITELANSKTDTGFVDFKASNEYNSELFRLLRTKLQFIINHPQEKVVLVTSTMPGEGKTFVSMNLAASLAMADKKVLLIGLDLRRPRLAKLFNLSNSEGVSSYLAGQTDDYRKLIYSSPDFPTMSVIAAGFIPPNPAELIMRDRLKLMIEELKTEFDYIILDTPPVGAVSDTLLIDKVSDMTLYITRAGVTDKRNVELINRIHHEKSLKKIYIVVNDVDVESTRYTYKRKYGYGYGYSYGHNSKSKT